MLNISSYKI